VLLPTPTGAGLPNAGDVAHPSRLHLHTYLRTKPIAYWRRIHLDGHLYGDVVLASVR
jgi:hypothetical protein